MGLALARDVKINPDNGLVMKGLMLCVSETRNAVTLAAHETRTTFFTTEVLTELCRQLVLNYFPLTDDDLRCWQSDPESFSMFLPSDSTVPDPEDTNQS